MTGVLGFPVAHSRSPAMHNAAFAAHGLDWRYVLLPVPPERFAETARALPRSGFRGANVTIPHKPAALALADAASEAARGCGAANTLTFGSAGLTADNTDAGGLLDALAEPVAGRRALVLGAGGAARGAAWALREAGAEVTVWNRTAERASALARELAVGHARTPAEARAEVVVNATSVGLDADLPEADALAALGGLERLEPPGVVVELVYADRPTPVERWAQRAGARVVDGLEVLVRQGARSFSAWTGRTAPLDAMRAAVGARGPTGAPPGRPTAVTAQPTGPAVD